jgi:hypothetical protein
MVAVEVWWELPPVGCRVLLKIVESLEFPAIQEALPAARELLRQ